VSDAISRFVDAMRADPALSDLADGFARMFGALDLEASACLPSSADAAGLYEALYWVVGRPDRLLREKLLKMHELIHRKGRQEGTIRELTGWR
jgi:hypothetical protein